MSIKISARGEVMTNLIFGIAAFLFIIFFIMYLRKPYRLINGFIFDCFIVSLLIGIIIFLASHNNFIFSILLLAIGAAVVFIFIFGIYLAVGYLMVNSIKMFQKERISLANSLSFILSIAIIIELIVGIFFTKYITNKVLIALFSLFICIEIYLFIVGISYITISLLNLLLSKYHKAHQDYFIVLGCGLIDGQRVSPLLAGRIDKAVTAYRKQKENGQVSKIIFSGGKGSDEKISESEAMQAYAVQHGVDAEDTIIENKSSNTLENMKFSKKIMDDISKGSYTCTFVTSDYHVFRAGIYAYKAGLRKVRGIGSKTKGYYIPNATIREYVALLVMNKEHTIIAIVFIFFIYVISWILIALPRIERFFR